MHILVNLKLIYRQNYIFSLLEIPLKPRFLGKTGNTESHPSNHLSMTKRIESAKIQMKVYNGKAQYRQSS